MGFITFFVFLYTIKSVLMMHVNKSPIVLQLTVTP